MNNSHSDKTGVVIGIDVGGSTTKIVGFGGAGGNNMYPPLFVRATDPLTSIYGALGRFTDENNINLRDISRIMVTGVGAKAITGKIHGVVCEHVGEFDCVGIGGLYLTGLQRAVCVSMGTGTALIYAERQCVGDNCSDAASSFIKYLGGTGVGGGTLVGLSRALLGMDDIDHIIELADGGDLSKIDLRVGDITRGHTGFQTAASGATLGATASAFERGGEDCAATIGSAVKEYSGSLPPDMTAANFGRLSDLASKSDLALGIMNMIFETVGMMAIFSARAHGVDSVVLTGNLSSMPICKRLADSLTKLFGIKFVIPNNSQFAAVIGAALNYRTEVRG